MYVVGLGGAIVVSLTTLTYTNFVTNYNDSGGSTTSTSPTGAGGRVGINAAPNCSRRIIRFITGRTRGRNLGIAVIPFSSCIAPGRTLTRNSVSMGSCRRIPFLRTFGRGGNAGLIPVKGACLTPLHLFSGGRGALSSLPSNTSVTVPGSPSGKNHTLLLLRGGNLLGLGRNIGPIGTIISSVTSGPGGLGVVRLRTPRLPETLRSYSTSVVGNNCTMSTKLSPGATLTRRSGADPCMGIVTTHRRSGSGPACRGFMGVFRARTAEGCVGSGFRIALVPKF